MIISEYQDATENPTLEFPRLMKHKETEGIFVFYSENHFLRLTNMTEFPYQVWEIEGSKCAIQNFVDFNGTLTLRNK